MVLYVVQRLCALTFFRPYRKLHRLLKPKAEISHEHCEGILVFLEPLFILPTKRSYKELTNEVKMRINASMESASISIKTQFEMVPTQPNSIGEINHVHTFLTNHKRTQRFDREKDVSWNRQKHSSLRLTPTRADRNLKQKI